MTGKVSWWSVLVFCLTICSAAIFGAFTTFETQSSARADIAEVHSRLDRIELRVNKIYELLVKVAR